MRYLIRLTRVISLLAIMGGGACPAFGSDDHGNGYDGCEKAFTGQVIVHHYGEGTPFAPELMQTLEQLRKAMIKLEYPESMIHHLYYLSAGSLAGLAARGVHPFPHYYDGLEVLRGAQGALGVMEFVHGGFHSGLGCVTCQSYYRKSTPLAEQKSVLAHVMGHNFMSIHSLYQRFTEHRAPMMASLEFSQRLREIRNQMDPEHVDQFVFWLRSLDYLQDVTGGFYQGPSSFQASQDQLDALRGVDPFEYFSRGGGMPRSEQGFTARPARPTRSALQFMVANPPSSMPQWQRDLLSLYEQTVAYFSGNIVTKTMNEGWATYSEILLPNHFEDKNEADIIKWSMMMPRVAYKDLQNPYWLGLEAWLRLYERFQTTHPELAVPPGEERRDPEHFDERLTRLDRAFVAYAKDIVSRTDDREFLRIALDARWVERNRLVLYRPALEHEVEGKDLGQPDPRIKNPVPYIVVSRDPERVIDYILKSKDLRRGIAQVELVNSEARGGTTMEWRHIPFEDVPLVKDSAIQTLYVLSLVNRKAQSLKTHLPWTDLIPFGSEPQPMWDWDRHGRDPNGWELYEAEVAEWKRRQAEAELAEGIPVDVEYRISPDGTLSVTVLDADIARKAEVRVRAIEEHFRDLIELYQLELRVANSDQFMSELQRFLGTSTAMQTVMQMSQAATSRMAEQLGDEVLEAPTLAEAAMEFYREKQKRAALALARVLKNGGAIRTKNGMRVQIFTEPPHFELDREFQKRMLQLGEPIPLDAGSTQMAFRQFLDTVPRGLGRLELGVVEDGRIQSIDSLSRRIANPIAFDPQGAMGAARDGHHGGGDLGGDASPGDPFWGPDPFPPPGGGKPVDPGTDGPDPAFIDFSLEEWGKLLDLKLPNVRPVRGGRGGEETERDDVHQSDYGVRREERMIPILLPKAHGYFVSAGGGASKKRMEELRLLLKKARSRGVNLLERGEDGKMIYYDLVTALRRIGVPNSELRNFKERNLVSLGFRLEEPGDQRVWDSEVVPAEQMRAVIVFVVDESGSMGDPDLKHVEETIWNARAALLATYDEVELQIVSFAHQGQVARRKWEEFGRVRFFGGTWYTGGLEEAERVLDDYPYEGWNRYLYVFGDGQAFGEDLNSMERILRKLNPTTQSMGFGFMLNGMSESVAEQVNTVQMAKRLERELPWFRYVTMNDYSTEGAIAALKKLFFVTPKDGQ